MTEGYLLYHVHCTARARTFSVMKLIRHSPKILYSAAHRHDRYLELIIGQVVMQVCSVILDKQYYIYYELNCVDTFV